MIRVLGEATCMEVRRALLVLTYMGGSWMAEHMHAYGVPPRWLCTSNIASHILPCICINYLLI